MNRPRLPPEGAPSINLPRDFQLDYEPKWSQEQLEAMMTAGQIPDEARDDRSTAERLNVLLNEAQRLGVIL